MRLITCDNVTLAYDGRVVVHDLHMQVNAGDYLCIVGENGSGKSTLMRALLGLKKPSGGAIRLENGLLQSEIGYLPQQTAVQRDFPATVREVVQSGLRGGALRPFLTAGEKARLSACLQLLEIADIAGRPYRALCATEKVLLLDEPVAGLDPAMTAGLYAVIERLHKRGVTIIMISHDIPAAVKYATHILHLRHTPLFFGTAADYAESAVGRRFLESEGEA